MHPQKCRSAWARCITKSVVVGSTCQIHSEYEHDRHSDRREGWRHDSGYYEDKVYFNEPFFTQSDRQNWDAWEAWRPQRSWESPSPAPTSAANAKDEKEYVSLTNLNAGKSGTCEEVHELKEQEKESSW